MKLSRSFGLLALPLVVAACGGGEGENGEDQTAIGDSATMSAAPADTTTAAWGDTADGHGAALMTVQLATVQNSGVSGEATLTEQGGEVQVSVRLTGLKGTGAHPGHVHQGTCDNLGSVVAPLPSVTPGADGTGTATGTAAVAMNTAMNGQHVVNYHLPDGKPAACGAITGHGAGH